MKSVTLFRENYSRTHPHAPKYNSQQQSSHSQYQEEPLPMNRSVAAVTPLAATLKLVDSDVSSSRYNAEILAAVTPGSADAFFGDTTSASMSSSCWSPANRIAVSSLSNSTPSLHEGAVQVRGTTWSGANGASHLLHSSASATIDEAQNASIRNQMNSKNSIINDSGCATSPHSNNSNNNSNGVDDNSKFATTSFLFDKSVNHHQQQQFEEQQLQNGGGPVAVMESFPSAGNNVNANGSGSNNSAAISYEVGNLSSATLSQIQQQQQAMAQQNQQKNPKLYKTELCRSWADTGRCNYGERCQYAHGENEKRPIPRHPKYKTEACQSYHKTGYCPYGPRCHFIHNEEPHVIAGLVAANNAATALGGNGGGTNAGSTSNSASVTPDVHGMSNGANGLRQINSLGGSLTSACSTPPTPRRGNVQIFGAPGNNSGTPMARNFGDHNNYQQHHQTLRNQQPHQPLMMTQSVGGALSAASSNAMYSTQHHHAVSNGNNTTGSSLQSGAAFFIGQAPQGNSEQQNNYSQQQQCSAVTVATTVTAQCVRHKAHHDDLSHYSSQQLPPTAPNYYKSSLTSQPQQHSQVLFNHYDNNYGGCFGVSANNNSVVAQGAINGADSSPTDGSLASADSGTESPELGSSSGSSGTASGSFSSPGLDLASVLATAGGTSHLMRLSPVSFRRHSSMVMMMKNGAINEDATNIGSFHSYATALDHSKDDDSHNSDSSTVMMSGNFLASPPNSRFEMTGMLATNNHVENAKFFAEFQNTLMLTNGADYHGTLDALGDGARAASAVGNSISASTASATIAPSAAEFFSTSATKCSWSNADLVTAPTTRRTAAPRHNAKKLFEEASEYSRRESCSSLGSAGAAIGTDEVSTPTSSSAASVMDEMWNAQTANHHPTTAATSSIASSGMTRLPIFEQLSNGPLI